jgi:hypothetical protein
VVSVIANTKIEYEQEFNVYPSVAVPIPAPVGIHKHHRDRCGGRHQHRAPAAAQERTASPGNSRRCH